MSARTGFLLTGAVIVCSWAFGCARSEGASRAGLVPPGVDSALQDTSITTEIRSLYLIDPHVDSSRIAIRTRAGEVTLTGSVASDDERRLADRMARDAYGVREVIDRLEVRP
ncbi:MAG TPA: BON domain-containing protein [Candidatus Polarisedimenticolia bacterium]|jgi:hyperosmotically inducible protein|nr:BON domain-containing protein [Candidatus Polarisedimenticolia bacterium]